MWIESISIPGFGCIINRHLKFPKGRLCLIIDENERGKSTLIAAILAAFCGFPSKRTSKGKVRPIDAFRPWSGESYAVELVFEAGGTRYQVLRDFAGSKFTVRDLRTNREVTAECHSDLAYHFFLLPREDYERIALISGKEVSYFDPSATIREKLMAVIEGSEHSQGAERALEILNSAEYHLNSRDIKPKTAINRIKEGIDQRSRELRELDSELEAASQDVHDLEQLRMQRDELETRLADLDIRYAASRLAEIKKSVTTAQQDLARREELIAEMKQLERYASFPAERKEQISNAAIRLSEIQNQIAERQADVQRVRTEVDELRNRVNTRKHLAAASRQNLPRLYAARERISNAAATLDNAQRWVQTQIARTDRYHWLGKVLLLAASPLLLAVLIALLDRNFQLGVALKLGLPALLAAVVGLCLYWRACRVRSEAELALQYAEHSYEQVSNSIATELSLLGTHLEGSSEIAPLLEKTIRELEIHLEEQSKLAELERELASLERSITDLRTREKQEREIIDSILAEAGISDKDPLEQALLSFKEGCKRYERYWQIKKSELPTLEGRIIPDIELSRLQEESEKLAKQLSNQPVQTYEQSSFELDAERQKVRRQLDEIARLISECERKVGVVVENYKRRYSAAQAELEALRLELKRATRFAEALQLAEKVLGEVVSEARLRWADVLNRRASVILPYLNPEYQDLRFDDSLAFTVRRVSDGRVVEKATIDACLSTGAKDQIYLAVRLACCCELSASGEVLPIILDDALIAFDDERFERTLRYLAEQLSTNQQVIMFTCHRVRHERLLDRDWFRNQVAVLSLN